MLGEELRKARRKAGLSQEDLGFRAGVDRSYISEIENEHFNPTVSMFLRLCKAMNASASEIIKRIEKEEV
jgi:transcriptional regulator with XRE-family HTH domain